MKRLFTLLLMLYCMLSASATVKICGKTLIPGSSYGKESIDGIMRGNINYSSDGKTLTLHDVIISATVGSSTIGLFADQDLIIALDGNNFINTSKGPALFLNSGRFVFSRTSGLDYRLTCLSTESSALRNENSNIEINRCEVSLSASDYTIWTSSPQVTETISVINGSFTISNLGGKTSTLQRLKELNLTGCSLAYGHHFHNGGVMESSTSNKFVTSEIKIVPDPYPVIVQSVRVNTLNKDDVLKDGTVFYSPSYSGGSGMLTLNNADLSNNGSAIMFENTSTGRTFLRTLKKNKVTCTGSNVSAIYSNVDLTIQKGDDETTLEVINNAPGGIGIRSNNSLIFSDMAVDIRAYIPMFTPISTKNNYLYIIESDITASTTSSSGYPVYGFPSVIFNNSNVTTPTAVTYDATQKYYTSNGALIDKLVISKGEDSTPATIHSLTTTAIEDKAATIRWNMEDNTVARNDIKVHYFLVEGSRPTGSWLKSVDLSPGSLSTTLTNLKSSTTYLFRLRVEDVKSGKYSFKDLVFTTEAPIDYGIMLGGVSVTSDNCDRIPIDAGSASYNPDYNILRLSRASINTQGIPAIRSTCKNLTIQFDGPCYLVSESASSIVLDCADGTFTLSGDDPDIDKLYLMPGEGWGSIFLPRNANLNVSDLTLVGEGDISGFSTLSLIRSDVRVSSIFGFSNLKYSSDMYVKTPEGGVYHDKYMYTSSGQMAENCEIVRDKPFDISINGTPFSISNYNDFYGNGTVSFSPSDNTLTLRNAYISEGTGIFTTLDKLTIKLIGENFIETEWECINAAHDLVIEGDDAESKNNVLKINSNMCESMYNGGNVSFLNCAVETGKMVGSGQNDLSASNSTILAENIVNYSQAFLTFESVKSPNEECTFSSEKQTFVNSKGEPQRNILIYPIEVYVENVVVNLFNCDDILGDGTASYDFTTHTLTLSGAKLHRGIEAREFINIVLEGDNSISPNGTDFLDCAVMLWKSANFYGPGRLRISNAANGVTCWNIGTGQGKAMVIKNCTLSIKTTDFGLVNNSYPIEIVNSNVEIRNSLRTTCPALVAASIVMNNSSCTTHTQEYLDANVSWMMSDDHVIIFKANKTVGDYTGDGKVTIRDLVSYINLLNSKRRIIYQIHLDLNCDGRNNIQDVEIFEKMLLNK